MEAVRYAGYIKVHRCTRKHKCTHSSPPLCIRWNGEPLRPGRGLDDVSGRRLLMPSTVALGHPPCLATSPRQPCPLAYLRWVAFLAEADLVHSAGGVRGLTHLLKHQVPSTRFSPRVDAVCRSVAAVCTTATWSHW